MCVSLIPIVANIRRGDLCDINIMRGHVTGPASLANRYAIGIDGDRSEVIRKYAYDFQLRWRTEPTFRASVVACQGKRLGCCCAPKLCHGHVIAWFIKIMLDVDERAACQEMLEIASGKSVQILSNY